MPLNAPPKIDMIEATRLTREGRLSEAMAVLRGARSLGPPPGFEREASQPSDDGIHRIIDMVPPSTESGGAWTPPQSTKTHTADHPSGASSPEIPEVLRGFLDRMGKIPSGRGFGSGARPARERARIQLPDGAQFDERIYASEAGQRAYKLYLPSGYIGQALPLVVMLHGCTQSPDDFAAGTRMNEIAEEQTFLVAYPAQSQTANISKCWNWFSAVDQQRDQGEPSLIAGITRQITREFAVAANRVYIAGLSAGGAAAAIMGATYPDLYGAIGVHSGLACGAASDLPSAFSAMRQGGSATGRKSRLSHGPQRAVPTIVFHGDRDTTVNPINGDEVIAQSRASADLRITVIHGVAPGGISYTRTVQIDDNGRPMLEQWVLHGAGHAWSGGSAAGSYTEPRGPDASREMVRFFLQSPAG